MKISNSAIQTFKACRRLYELKYIYGLEPVKTSDALSRGSKYHELVEYILSGGTSGTKFEDCDDVKVKAMATAFQMYVLAPLQERVSINLAEKWFNYCTKSGHTVIGRLDAVTSSNEVIEHKTTSGVINGDYFTKLDFDEQIPTYMIACNTNKAYYTVCSVPTIRQKKNETDEDFYLRCVNWYSEDTGSKIAVIEFYKDAEQLDEFVEGQDAIITEIEKCKLFYRNPAHCQKWGRKCEYAPICLNYDPKQDYIQFVKKEHNYDKAGETYGGAEDD